MSYYGYFPDSAMNVLFAKDKLVPPGKKIVVFLGQNMQVLDSFNLKNRKKKFLLARWLW